MWVDRNHDGVCSNDENYSIGQLHITQVNLEYREATADEAYGFDDAGNWHRYKGTFHQRAPGSAPGKMLARTCGSLNAANRAKQEAEWKARQAEKAKQAP